MGRNDELENFKTDINLTHYAATQGYQINTKKSSRTSVVMSNGSSDKVVIAISEHDKHWIYFSVGNSNDSGSIIDFVQNRKSLNLGGVRQELRPWTKGNIPSIEVSRYVAKLKPSSNDRANVVALFEAMQPITNHQYLEQVRQIPASILQNPRFARKIYSDQHANAVFPHYDHDGLCGYEIRNNDFKGFAVGGTKGLWFSAVNRGDKRLVVAEGGIKALSYHILHPDKQTRFMSSAGRLNNIQPDLIRSAISRLADDGQLIIATDADKGGRELADQIKTLATEAHRSISVRVHQPATMGFDWNDELIKKLSAKQSPQSHR